eukprot:1185309-Prorocentrum_minimum.AAC.3
MRECTNAGTNECRRTNDQTNDLGPFGLVATGAASAGSARRACASTATMEKDFLDVARPRSGARPDFRSVPSEAISGPLLLGGDPPAGGPGRRPRNVKEDQESRLDSIL